jgi:hypothetical protein
MVRGAAPQTVQYGLTRRYCSGLLSFAAHSPEDGNRRDRKLRSACLRRTERKGLLQHRTAGVCAFSLTSRITQRDGTPGRDAPGSRTLLYPATRDRTGRLHRDVHGRPAADRNPAHSMIPDWRPSPGPGSPGAHRHPAALPFTSAPQPSISSTAKRTVSVRQARRTGRQHTTAIQEDPVGGRSGHRTLVRMHRYRRRGRRSPRHGVGDARTPR